MYIRRLLTITLTVSMCLVVGLQGSALARSEAERRAMGIYFLSDHVPTSCIPTTLAGNDNIEKVYNFLIGKELEPFQVYGIMGNLKAESRFNPNADEAPAGDGYGLAQWSFGRRDKLEKKAKDTGVAVNDLGFQLDFLWEELNAHPYKTKVLDPLKQTTTLEEAAYIFMHDFEVPTGRDTVAKKEEREGMAREVQTALGGSVTASAVSNPGSASSIGCSGALTGQNTQFVDGMTIYSQYDPAWRNTAYSSSTIGVSGCGPSAMATIITALTNQKVTPAATASYAASRGLYVPGVGSSWNIGPVLAPNWGLRAEPVGRNVMAIAAALNKGGLVIAPGAGPAPFTSGGHFIVIRGLTADGRFKVADSNRAVNNTKDWEPNQVVNYMRAGGIYAIYK